MNRVSSRGNALPAPVFHRRHWQVAEVSFIQLRLDGRGQGFDGKRSSLSLVILRVDLRL